MVQSNTPSVTVAASPTVSIAPVGPLTMDVGQVQVFTATPLVVQELSLSVVCGWCCGWFGLV